MVSSLDGVRLTWDEARCVLEDLARRERRGTLEPRLREVLACMRPLFSVAIDVAEPKDEWVTVAVAADRLECSREYVRQLCDPSRPSHLDRLRAELVGRSWRIDPESVADLKAQKAERKSA